MDHVSKYNNSSKGQAARHSCLTSGQAAGYSCLASGQATVEYVLLLVLFVAVILGGIYQFNSAFQVWANAYFGENGYLSCLLETGELPSLGGEAGECQQEFREFALSDGGDGTFGGGAGGGPGDGAGGGAGDDASGGSGGGGGGSFSAAEGGGAGIGRAGRGRSNRIPIRGGGGAGEGDGSQQNMGGGLTTGLGYDTDSGGRVVRIPLRDGGLYARGVRGRPEQDGQATRQKVEREGEGRKPGDGPVLVRVQERAPAQVDEFEADGFDFGYFLRYLIIIAIIIAILVFVGSQIHQASKNI